MQITALAFAVVQIAQRTEENVSEGYQEEGILRLMKFFQGTGLHPESVRGTEGYLVMIESRALQTARDNSEKKVKGEQQVEAR